MSPGGRIAEPPGAVRDLDEPGSPLHRLLQLRQDTAKPLYQQLEQQLAGLIGSGRLLPGMTLPAERQLAEALNVSRSTVRSSYNALRDRHLIAAHGRHGFVVQDGRARLLPGMDRLKGFTQEMNELGHKPSTKVLEHGIVTDEMIAALLGLPAMARFLRLVRIRYGDGAPLSRESAWYSLDVAPGLETADVGGSIYAQLAAAGLALGYCDQTIEATMPNPSECEAFELVSPVPCLLIKRKSYLSQGVAVEYVEGLFRGDAYVYRLRLDA